MKPVRTRREASDAVSGEGWRFLLGAFRASVPVGSLAQAADVVARAIAACGDDADRHLRADLRSERVVLTLQTLEIGRLTDRDIDLAHRVSAAVAEAGLRTEPEIGGAARSVQILEVGIDALDIDAIRPFWKALLGYADDGGALADPVGQGPAIWFQQMDEPRPQRNRLHFDVCVPHDEAPRRLEAALAARGTLVTDKYAPAFWVLADAEGNEACVTTWQGRD